MAAQKRALFYVFDGGTGVGHLRRLCAIARQLQGRFACLIITGHRAAAHWFVPEACEYVHLPAWDHLVEAKAGYWGRKPFLEIDRAGAIDLRQRMLRGVVDAFQPDALFVDHLPLGTEAELAPILADGTFRKYLVTRGVQNETEDLARLLFSGPAYEALRSQYDRILVAADPRVFDFARAYDLDPVVRAKTTQVGYVTQRIPPEAIVATRHERGLGPGDRWVVASAGGGQLGENLIGGCLELVDRYPELAFDIVVGPRSRLPWDDPQRQTIARGRLRLHKEVPHMPSLNASADLVISSAGYNTLLETVQGRANLLCFPFRRDVRDEQYQHAARLQAFVQLDLSTDLSDLPALFAQAIARLGPERVADRRGELDLDGAVAIERIVLDDLGAPAR